MRYGWAFLILLCTPQLIYGWGDVGHQTVAYLAEKSLDAQGSQLIEDLLGGGTDDISDAAVWPDAVKFPRPYTRPWHYINALGNPPNECRVYYPRDCGKHGCIVSAIENMTRQVYDASLDRTEQSEALKFLIHFIGDIHQPLHVEAEGNGGNKIPVCFDRRCSNKNLHSVWDIDILHKINGIKHNLKHKDERDAAAEWAKRLFQTNKEKHVAKCTSLLKPVECAMLWATETNRLNCKFVFKMGNKDLGGKYYDQAAPVVEEQIFKAGIRLAGWLNALAAERILAESRMKQEL